MVGYSGYEYMRYSGKYELCAREYDGYKSFVSESVCNSTFTSLYTGLGLINCTKAANKIVEETTMLCALRNWFMTSWMSDIMINGSHLWEKVTGMVMIMLVIPISAVIILVYKMHEDGTTNRHALTLEAQQQTQVQTLTSMGSVISSMQQTTQQQKTRPRRTRSVTRSIPKPNTVDSEDLPEDY